MSETKKNNDEESRNNNNKLLLPPSRQNLLIEFAHRHVDFLHAELESVLTMNEIKKDIDYKMIPLPNDDIDVTKRNKSRAFMILSFSWNFWNDKSRKSKDTTNDTNNKTNDNDLVSILSRCILIRSVIELWGMSNISLKDCASNVKKQYDIEKEIAVPNQKLLFPYFKQEQSWKLTIHTFGCKYTREEQNGMRADYAFLPFQGPVLMIDPTNEYILIREIEVNETGSPIEVNELKPKCIATYFGRILGSSRNWRQGRIEEISLKRRSYLGPTSMDAELSSIMCNIAQIKKNSFCFDPFVGTGSLLLSCGLYGAFCFGTDIDIRILKGKGRHENIFTNFDQYNLPRPELVRSDNSIYHRHFRSHLPLFDAIICDPPYGIRAGARQSGSRYESFTPIADEHRYDHIAQTRPYPVSDVMKDLLDLAADKLKMNGKLVYIIPSMNDFDINTDLPQHPCLNLTYCCYQPLQTNLGRSVVCMEKIAEYDETQRQYYRDNIWKNGVDSAEKIINLRERLVEEARKRPGYVEKAEYRKKKRRQLKDERKKLKSSSLSKSSN